MKEMKPRFTITINEEILNEIDDFRYENRYPARTQVINELLRIGLEEVKHKMADETEMKNESR